MELLIILLGLVIGSFLNVVLYRTANGGSIIKGRSKCPKCGKVLKWYELIPVFSFAAQAGKCRGCKEKISWQYPLVEIFTSGVFFILWQFYLKDKFFVNNILFICFSAAIFFLAAALILILFYDLEHMEIPNSFLIWGIIFSFIPSLIKDINLWTIEGNVFLGGMKQAFLKTSLGSGLIGIAVAGGFFLALVLVSKEKWMGQGDIYVGVIIGMMTGWPWILESLLLAFTGGALIGIGLLIFKIKKFKAQIAFGPFLILAALIILIWGEALFYWYMKFLLP